MIKVCVSDVCNSESDEPLYNYDAEFIAEEDSPSWGVVEMFVQAMRTAGYVEKSIFEAMYDYAIEHAQANGIDLREKI